MPLYVLLFRDNCLLQSKINEVVQFNTWAYVDNLDTLLWWIVLGYFVPFSHYISFHANYITK